MTTGSAYGSQSYRDKVMNKKQSGPAPGDLFDWGGPIDLNSLINNPSLNPQATMDIGRDIQPDSELGVKTTKGEAKAREARIDRPETADDKPYRDAFHRYSGWKADIEKQYESNLSATRARLASKNVSRDSELWTNSMEKIEAEFTKDMKFLNEGATWQYLRSHAFELSTGYEEFGAEGDWDNFINVKGDGLDFFGYLAKRYGVGDGDDETEQEKSMKQAKQAASGTKKGRRTRNIGGVDRAIAAEDEQNQATQNPWV